MQQAKFTYASAFAGIGGMTFGLKDLGGEAVIAWEYDPAGKSRQYAQEAHRLLHPEILVQGDICEANPEELPDFDLFCFTPPCQAFSTAGKRGGFDDTRGTLVFEALRIAKAKKPKVLFMENVKGLVNHDKGSTLATIIHAINEIGYTVDFTVLNSKFFDVAQSRERVYLVAVRSDLVQPEAWKDVEGNTMLPKAKRRYQKEGARTFNFDWPKEEAVRTQLRDFLEADVDESYYISEEKASQLIATIADVGGLPIREATKKGYAIAHEGDAVNLQYPNSKTRRGRVGKQLANTLEASGINQGVVEIRPCVSPDYVHKSMNGRRIKGDGDESFTLTAVDRHGVAIGNYPHYRIRKFTPRECLRLQAVPESAINMLAANFSDARLYKFAGNGLTTTVVKAIGERLTPYVTAAAEVKEEALYV